MNSLLSILFFMIPSEDAWAVFADWFAAYANDIAIKAMKALATAFWFLEKIAAGITRFFLEESMWDIIINVVFDQLKATLPGVLRDVIAPTGIGSGAGLLYLALFLAGLLMVIPGIDHKRLVDPSRVILWAFIVGLLFISNTTGYDIIGAIEKLRGDSANIIIGANSRNLDDLVADPMIASPADLDDYSFVLSTAFENQYFPEPTDFNNRNAEMMDAILVTWNMPMSVETDASQKDRRQKAQIGLAISALTIIGAGVLLMIAFILGTLTASAIILIMFFLIALPVGFFEFGSAILSGITRQYTYIWAITLLSAILPRVLIAANSLTYLSGPTKLNEIMNTVPILIIVAIATSYISAMAGKAMLDTFSVISTSISTAMAPLNYAGSMPQGGMLGGGPLQAGANMASAGMNLAGTAALAAATGGASVLGTAALAGATGGSGAALMAGAGSIIGNVSKKGGGIAAGVAIGMMGQKASVFASAAGGRGAAQVAQVAGSQRRRQKQEREKQNQTRQNQFAKANQIPDDLDEKSWDSFDAGNYQTTNTDQLDFAEEAYARNEFTTARNHLTLAFGSREVADEAMQHYQAHGEAGMQQVREIVETTQSTALKMAISGERLFDKNGQASSVFKNNLYERLSKNHSYDPTDPAQAALSAQISGAVVRPNSHLPNHDLLGSLALAQTVLDPGNPKAEVSDESALLRLQQHAQTLNWAEQDVEALFEATREGRVEALNGEYSEVEAVTLRMAMHGELSYLDTPASREMARLALLVTKPPTDSKSKHVHLGQRSQTNSPRAVRSRTYHSTPQQAPTRTYQSTPQQAPTGASQSAPQQAPTGAYQSAPQQAPTGAYQSAPQQAPTGTYQSAPQQVPTAKDPLQPQVSQAPPEWFHQAPPLPEPDQVTSAPQASQVPPEWFHQAPPLPEPNQVTSAPQAPPEWFHQAPPPLTPDQAQTVSQQQVSQAAGQKTGQAAQQAQQAQQASQAVTQAALQAQQAQQVPQAAGQTMGQAAQQVSQAATLQAQQAQQVQSQAQQVAQTQVLQTQVPQTQQASPQAQQVPQTQQVSQAATQATLQAQQAQQVPQAGQVAGQVAQAAGQATGQTAGQVAGQATGQAAAQVAQAARQVAPQGQQVTTSVKKPTPAIDQFKKEPT